MKTYRQPGSVLQISGISSGTIPAGSLYRRTGGTQFQRAWIGIVIDDIVGTGTALTTLDGRPIDIGDGMTTKEVRFKGAWKAQRLQLCWRVTAQLEVR